MKIKCHIIQLLLLSFLFFSFFASSEDKEEKIDIIWVTEAWKNYTNEDGTGLYHELFEVIFHNSPYNIQVKYLPWKRALREIETKQANISGALPKNGKYLFADIPILTEPISILRQKTETHLTLQKISKLVGVWPQQYANEILFPSIVPYINGVGADYRKDALHLLKIKKVDYYLDIRTMLEIQLALWPESEQQKYYIQDLATSKLYLVFSDDPKGKALKHYYDTKTKALLDQNILQKIYQKYQLSFPLFE